jgi:hypothetical protein
MATILIGPGLHPRSDEDLRFVTLPGGWHLLQRRTLRGWATVHLYPPIDAGQDKPVPIPAPRKGWRSLDLCAGVLKSRLPAR